MTDEKKDAREWIIIETDYSTIEDFHEGGRFLVGLARQALSDADKIRGRE